VKKLDAYRVFIALSVLVDFLFSMIFTASMVYQVTRVGLTPLQLVLVGTTLELSVFLFEVPTGVIADIYSRRLSIIIGYFVMGLGFLVEGSFPLFAAILLAQVLWGVGYTFTSGATQAWISDEIGEQNAGRAFLRGNQLGQISGLLGILTGTLLGSLMTTGMMSGYYAVTIWVPTYLKTVRNLSVLNTGAYTFMIIAGSFVGYIVAAYLSDHLGRRKTFIVFAVGTVIVAVLYTLVPISDQAMLFLGFPLGFFLSGNFSGVGAFLTELFPSRVRGSGQGFVYNVGRGLGAFSPPLVGYLSTGAMPLATAIGAVTGTAFALVVLTVFFLPETRGKELSVYD